MIKLIPLAGSSWEARACVEQRDVWVCFFFVVRVLTHVNSRLGDLSLGKPLL